MVNVHHISPARSDKNYGKAINDIVRLLPDDSWVCLRDIDTLPLDHSAFIRQCEEIAAKNEFGLVSCMTNRLGLPHQLINGRSQPEHSINLNREVHRAKALAKQYGSQVDETEKEVAGVMMLFPKKVWADVGGFREGGILFGHQLLDNVFYEAVRDKGYRVAIAPGIYLLHLYRWGKDRRNKEHLI